MTVMETGRPPGEVVQPLNSSLTPITQPQLTQIPGLTTGMPTATIRNSLSYSQVAGNAPASSIQGSPLNPPLPSKQVTYLHGEPTFMFEQAEIDTLVMRQNLKWAVVGKFSHGMPEIEFLRTEIPKQLKLKAEVNIGYLYSRHVLIRCSIKEDYDVLMSINGSFDIKKKNVSHPMRSMKWEINFDPTKETSIAWAWISFPNLPPNYFEESTLLSFASTVGRPVCVDKATINKTRPSCARVKVEVDLLREHPTQFTIQIAKDGEIITNSYKIEFDVLPKYCTKCRLQGHDVHRCWKLNPSLKPSKESPTPPLPSNETPQNPKPIVILKPQNPNNPNDWQVVTGKKQKKNFPQTQKQPSQIQPINNLSQNKNKLTKQKQVAEATAEVSAAAAPAAANVRGTAAAISAVTQAAAAARLGATVSLPIDASSDADIDGDAGEISAATVGEAAETTVAGVAGREPTDAAGFADVEENAAEASSIAAAASTSVAAATVASIIAGNVDAAAASSETAGAVGQKPALVAGSVAEFSISKAAVAAADTTAVTAPAAAATDVYVVIAGNGSDARPSATADAARTAEFAVSNTAVAAVDETAVAVPAAATAKVSAAATPGEAATEAADSTAAAANFEWSDEGNSSDDFRITSNAEEIAKANITSHKTRPKLHRRAKDATISAAVAADSAADADASEPGDTIVNSNQVAINQQLDGITSSDSDSVDTEDEYEDTDEEEGLDSDYEEAATAMDEYEEEEEELESEEDGEYEMLSKEIQRSEKRERVIGASPSHDEFPIEWPAEPIRVSQVQVKNKGSAPIITSSAKKTRGRPKKNTVSSATAALPNRTRYR